MNIRPTSALISPAYIPSPLPPNSDVAARQVDGYGHSMNLAMRERVYTSRNDFSSFPVYTAPLVQTQ